MVLVSLICLYPLFFCKMLCCSTASPPATPPPNPPLFPVFIEGLQSLLSAFPFSDVAVSVERLAQSMVSEALQAAPSSTVFTTATANTTSASTTTTTATAPSTNISVAPALPCSPPTMLTVRRELNPAVSVADAPAGRNYDVCPSVIVYVCVRSWGLVLPVDGSQAVSCVCVSTVLTISMWNGYTLQLGLLKLLVFLFTA